MPTKSGVKTITRDPAWLGPAVHPGEMLLEEFLKPLGWTQVEAVGLLDAPAGRLGPARGHPARFGGLSFPFRRCSQRHGGPEIWPNAP